MLSLGQVLDVPGGGLEYWWEYHLEPHLVLKAVASPPTLEGRQLQWLEMVDPQARLPPEVFHGITNMRGGCDHSRALYLRI